MVRLKENSGNYGKDKQRNFNSTMVRLKASCCFKEKGLEIQFQFHYGSVKSLLLKFVFDNFF